MDMVERRHTQEVSYMEWLVARRNESIDDLGSLAIAAVSGGMLTYERLSESAMPEIRVVAPSEKQVEHLGRVSMAELVTPPALDDAFIYSQRDFELAA